MSERVAITGIGCVSCFGQGHHAFIDAIVSGKSGIAPIDRFTTTGCRSQRAALLKDFNPGAFIPPLKLRRVDAVGQMTLVSAHLLFDDAGLPREGGRDDMGIALGTATAGLDSLVEYLGGLTDRGPTGVPAILFSNTVSNAPASLSAIEFRLRGPNVTFNQREASSLSALVFSVTAIRQGRANAMITGGADCLEETYFKVHDRFGGLSPARRCAGLEASGDEAARPFDRRHNGLVLGEGSFLVLLEASASAIARGARQYGEVLGIGATASKTGLNRWPSTSDGLADAMKLALCDAGLRESDVAAVVAAGNGSPELDALECEAVTRLFSRSVPMASIKGAIGECGAAGAAGLVAGVLALAQHRLFPTAGLDELDSGLIVNASNRTARIDGSIFILNSVAAGGTNYSIVVKAAT